MASLARLIALSLTLAGAQLLDDECEVGNDCALHALQRDARRLETVEEPS